MDNKYTASNEALILCQNRCVFNTGITIITSLTELVMLIAITASASHLGTCKNNRKTTAAHDIHRGAALGYTSKQFEGKFFISFIFHTESRCLYAYTSETSKQARLHPR